MSNVKMQEQMWMYVVSVGKLKHILQHRKLATVSFSAQQTIIHLRIVRVILLPFQLHSGTRWSLHQ